jgi:hypothetical protein
LHDAGSPFYLITSFVNRRTPELLRELVGELLPSPYIRPLKTLFLAYLVVSLVVFAIDSPCPLTPMTQHSRPVVPRQIPPHLQHPNEMALNVNLQESVWRLLENDDPPNTKKQQEPKMKEYFEFCRMMYPNDPHFNILKREKMYQFMYYQAFREKKKRGGSVPSRVNQCAFNLAHYLEVMGSFVDPSTGNNLTPTPAPAEPISKSVFEAYKATFRTLFRFQKMRGVLVPQWEDLWMMEFDDLRKHVLLRAPRHKTETYQEKVSNDFAPYLYVDKYDAMEEELWRDSTKNRGHCNVASGLRHRYVLLHLSSGIL